MSSSRARQFSDLSLLPSTQRSLSALNFSAMTPVQAATLPLFLAHKDVCVEACTGSGKTLAFVIPIVERLFRSLQSSASADGDGARAWPPARVGAIVIAPTRELATQIFSVARPFCTDAGIAAACAVGGSADVDAEVRLLASRGANVLVATPGRLLDVLRRCAAAGGGSVAGKLHFGALEVLVLDEADTLLALGFHAALTEILSLLPKQRRTGLFSATQTREVRALARAGLRNPAVVTVRVQHAGVGVGDGPAAGADTQLQPPPRSTQATPAALRNFYTLCASPVDKLVQLGAALRAHAAAGEKSIVFVLTCASVDAYARLLNSDRVRAALGLPSASVFPILPLHGQMVPKKRIGNFAAFGAAHTGALLCTDVAARGIDVPDVAHIVQFDPPQDPSFFIHRVGRTARAGRTGSALLLLLEPEKTFVDLLGVRAVPITERPRALPPPGAAADEPALVRVLQAESLDDRDVLEKTTRAFVSFLRGYKEHHCRVIFSLPALDASGLAASFGLVKLPKVDELRDKRPVYTFAVAVRTRDIAYADQKREVARQARMIANADAIEAEMAARDARRERALAAASAPAAAAPKRKRKHVGANARIHDEFALLQREEALEKRLRKGKISKVEYKAEMKRINRDSGISAAEENDAGLSDGDGEDESGEDGEEEDGAEDDDAESGLEDELDGPPLRKRQR